MSLEDNYVFVNGKSAPFADAYLTQSKDIIRFGFDFISIQKINYECKKNNDAVNDAKQKKMKGRLSDLNFGPELWNGTVPGLEFWSGTLEWNNPGCYGMTSQGKPSSQLIIPLSNATVERIFLHQNLIKTKSRNKLCTKNLNRQLMILINGPDIEDFDFEKAYDNWINLKARRIQNIKEHIKNFFAHILLNLISGFKNGNAEEGDVKAT
ncbi:hypothetical protein RhiirC2_777555 [Rhizophagus irregularis]|uniref:Uncharacterized protein n=1 Tax=Rhizophagus irregularis TaxID=588596 RepID=A0A2N1NE11_9GLOM|nr:hypothetical protein RhiirC2_777555 [Rhizophagus irregularis]